MKLTGRQKRDLKKEAKRTLINLIAVIIIGSAGYWAMKSHITNGMASLYEQRKD